MQFSIINPLKWSSLCSKQSFPPQSTFTVPIVSLQSVTSNSECVSCLRWRLGTYPRRSIRLTVTSSNKDRTSNCRERAAIDCNDGGVSSPLVEVIGIGSRKDAVLRFCLESPFRFSQSVRYWNIRAKDPLNVQLEERLLETDPNPRCLDASQFLETCSQTIVLVASAGYGLDQDAAVNILKTVRSRNGLAIAIVLHPFSFEGKRRQAEVKTLIEKLQEHADFYIDMATDLLLKTDTVTLDEALRTADTAVSLAIKAISLVVSPQETHKKLIDGPRDHVKGLAVSSILKNLENQKEANIGFGVGNSIRDSVMQALYDCPFIGTGIKNSNRMVFCIITSSDIMEDEDLHATLDIFRQTLQFTGKVVIASSHEPNLEPNMLVTSIIVIGRPQTQALPKKNIFSTLAEHFPSILKFFMGNQQLEDSKEFNTSSPSKTIHPLDTNAEADVIPLNGMADGADRWHEDDNSTVFRGLDEDFDFGDGIGDEDPLTGSSGFNDHITEGSIAFQRELLQNGNLGLGHLIAEKWAKQRARTPILDNLSIFPLPVGVRRPEDSGDIEDFPDTEEQQEGNEENAFQEQLRDDPSISSLGALTDAGFLAVKDFYSYASTLLKSRNDEAARKQGVLSVRAASVLESERDSPRKWSPTTEMQYRGGVYKGRCQGGLPEGKGRLVLHDGSIYDGMWHYGKRSGLGAFYFSNGDVFQGSWRDDVMHGKGWFYFHTGDRWFANFWKGKANGESRFYSKLGDVFFGQFQDGWRQGDFLCVDVEGTRCIEVWNKGVLVSRKPLDSDNVVR